MDDMPEVIRQGLAFVNSEREFSRLNEKAKWEREQAQINACCALPADEVAGIAQFGLWFMFCPIE